MAAVTPTLSRNKQKCRTFTATGSGAATDTITNALLQSGALAYGPIYSFLAATYADEAAANAAAAAAGISLEGYGAGFTGALKWVASSSTPSLSWTSAAASPIVLIIKAPGIGA